MILNGFGAEVLMAEQAFTNTTLPVTGSTGSAAVAQMMSLRVPGTRSVPTAIITPTISTPARGSEAPSEAPILDGHEYTEAMKAQADQILDLSPSIFDKIGGPAVWAVSGAVLLGGYFYYRSRKARGLAGYRRRRRR